ncbi:TIGR02757 family protein [Helicobacter muridarum]|uniref:Protein of uncharacterized function (DUF2400) n=1 Tax=Helicobacter muridarum TaxID=216 RepID=A0A377PV84_9HELI|nr:TIGR02757 family protein [Helicobacter muridarum]TLD98581.1 TIGR02757 family protein [Helicobacter muridarum]STQ85533.1 Protein of uncharacterised function (DUF2400) [Helicobacter muridarum]
MDKLKELLDFQYLRFNAKEYLDIHPDPISIVKGFVGEKFLSEIAFICACYSYGNAKVIVKNLANMPFHIFTRFSDYKECGTWRDKVSRLLIQSIQSMPMESFPYYRFQTRLDTKICFLVIAYIIRKGGIYKLFLSGYLINCNVLDGIRSIQDALKEIISKELQEDIQNRDFLNSQYVLESKGLQFLFGKKGADSALKRYNMFLRWMVRRDYIDLGIWDKVDCKDLMLPVDTHTFRICKAIGLCKTKTANYKAVVEITNNLRRFDSIDPVKYDFALYRIGQLGDNALEDFVITNNKDE